MSCLPRARALRPHWGDAHPFAWYPAVAVPLATVLGWVGLRGSA